MEQQYLTIWDLVLTPLYLVVLILIAKRSRDKHYPEGHPLRRYYLPGLYVKFGGAIFIALLYQFYYGEGDTFNFFQHSRIINSALNDPLDTWPKLITRSSWEKYPYLYKYASQMPFYNDASAYSVAVIGAILGLLNGTTYLPIAMLFAYLSYTGIWAMYRTFVNIYPTLHKQLAVAFLFIPSTFVWGSAVFKDTLCMFGLGWMTYTTFRIFINKDFSFRNFLILLISFYLIALVKVYILLCFLPALGFWLFNTHAYRVKSAAVRYLLILVFGGIVVSSFVVLTTQFSGELNKYSFDKIVATSATTRDWISYASGDEGSAYDLGNFEPTFAGFAAKFPAAVNVTLFRPYIWEIKKVVVALSAIEALLFLLLTLYVFFRSFTNAMKWIVKDPNILFCFIYSIFFAFAVGISTFNFGALSRYKIPCLPFYAAVLAILYYRTSSHNMKDSSRHVTVPHHSVSTSFEKQAVPKS